MSEAEGVQRIHLLEAVYMAARGLCAGYDWKHGTHAALHNYRGRLLEAVNAIDALPDIEGKLREAKRCHEEALAVRK